MILERKCINVYGGDMCPQIDFVVTVDECDYHNAIRVIDDAETDWHNSDTCLTIAEFIGERLDDNNIPHEIYFKNEEEEEEW